MNYKFSTRLFPWATGVVFGSLFIRVASPAIAQTQSFIEDDDLQIAQTTVSELSDVSPTDWAFDALQSLMERYGCIAGYPDGTFRGDRPAGRFEMVAALNACLDALGRESVSQEDLETIKAIQADMIATLQQTQFKVDALEARTDILEAQQFSTTTKLQGEVIMSAQFGGTIANVDNPTIRIPVTGAGPDAIANLDQPRITSVGEVNRIRATAISRVRLSFNTSFSGSDLLTTTLETGNSGTDFFGEKIGLSGPANPFPVPAGIATNNRQPLVDLGAIAYGDVGNEVSLYRLSYTFKPTKDLALTVGTNMYPSDHIDFNSYANNEATDFNSGFFINNPLIVTNTVDNPGGAGGAFDWNVGGGPFSLRGLYLASSATSPIAGDNGLFAAPLQASAEVEYKDNFSGATNNHFAARLQYTHGRTKNDRVIQNSVGANLEATFGKFGLFGRYGISLDPTRSDDNAPGRLVPTNDLFAFVPGVGTNKNIQTWMAGIAYKDLFLDGSLLGFAVGQPFLVSSSQAEYSPQTNYELFYRMPVSDYISLTPALMVITNPFNLNNAAGTPDNSIFQAIVRTTFMF